MVKSVTDFVILVLTRETSVWRRTRMVGNKQKCPDVNASVVKTTGDPRIGSPVREKG